MRNWISQFSLGWCDRKDVGRVGAASLTSSSPAPEVKCHCATRFFIINEWRAETFFLFWGISKSRQRRDGDEYLQMNLQIMLMISH